MASFSNPTLAAIDAIFWLLTIFFGGMAIISIIDHFILLGGI